MNPIENAQAAIKALSAVAPLPPAMEQALGAMKDLDMALALRIFAMQLAAQHKENGARLEKIEQKLDGAFPGGDAEGHCRAHEVMIELAEERKRLRRAIVEKSVPALFWALLVVIGTALAQYVLKLIADHLK